MPNPPILPIPPATALQVNAAVAAGRRLNLLTTATISWNQAQIIWLLSDQEKQAPPELLNQIAAAQTALNQWQQESQAQWQDPDPAQEPPRCWPITPAGSRMACGRSAMEHGYTFNPNFVTCPQCQLNLGAGQPGYVDHRSRWAVAASQELARALLAAHQETHQQPTPQPKTPLVQAQAPAQSLRQPALLPAA